MITPLDIQNKEFRKSMRGYKESEVDEFLDEIINDYEKLYKENKELNDKIEMVQEQIKKYETIENTLRDTLVVAQSTAEDIGSNARKQAEIIVQEAEARAKEIIGEANKEVLNINKEYEQAKQQLNIFKTRFKTLLESQLETMEKISEEI
ncbi:MAG: DivIVA domain-containing protein [Anaeromicrobium sp.]|jgi:cell division initiation protein|uniref:DivIVA domain-containing protein n=1 Tax=Anaeromicrobium sp. TaxID=1929132 RepID=UPI0025FB8C00|nr:DivIVA domain-containing protein [Anaeromicrobium sp.]MCT4592896.1 DivIVA domain-containing protein [Anaeromicrobium sp.]